MASVGEKDRSQKACSAQGLIDTLRGKLAALVAIDVRPNSEIWEIDETLHALESVCKAKEEECESLRHRLENALRKLFGRSSEKRKDTEESPGQMQLFNEAEVVADSLEQNDQAVRHKKPRTKPAGSGRKALPEWIEREEHHHEPTQEELRCAACGSARPLIGEDRSEKLELIPARAVIHVQVRPRYGACSCEGFTESGQQAVVQAPAPVSIAPGSQFGDSTLAHLLVSKYADALPFHRQEEILRRVGVEIDRGTMARYAIRIGSALGPLLALMHRDLRASSAVGMDETPVQVLKQKGRKAGAQSRMWVARGYWDTGPIVMFFYSPTRGAEVARAILGERYCGYLQTDGYAGYESLGKREGITHVGCWAHIRRKFFELPKGEQPGAREQMLELIKELYQIQERYLTALKSGSDSQEAFAWRKSESCAMFDRIEGWLRDYAQRTPPRLPLGLAISYALGQFERAKRYVDHPRLTPDNNLVENAIRPFVVGRKNWLFSDTPRGALASSTLYSIIETAKANRHEPYKYLCHLFAKLPLAQSEAELEALLPYHLNPTEY